MLNQEEQIQLYLEAYREGFQLSDSSSYTTRTKAASAYAGSVVPQVGQALVEYFAYIKTGEAFMGEPAMDPDRRKFALQAAVAVRKLRLKWIFLAEKALAKAKAGPKPPKEWKPPSPPSTSAQSPADVPWPKEVEEYIFLAEKNSWLPTDAVCAGLTGHTEASFRAARGLAEMKGFRFKQVPNGWQVIQRPETRKERIEQLLKTLGDLLSEQE